MELSDPTHPFKKVLSNIQNLPIISPGHALRKLEHKGYKSRTINKRDPHALTLQRLLSLAGKITPEK